MFHTYQSQNVEALINELIPEFDLQKVWIEELLYLVTQKYPSLDVYGSKKNLTEDIKRIIENSLEQEEQTTS